MSEDNKTLAADWREQVRLLGKRGFENGEMLRLGFITQETMDQLLAESEISREQYNQAIAQIATARAEVNELTEQIEKLEDVDFAIAEIRSRRIERVKEERAARREVAAAVAAQRAVEVAEQRRTAPTWLGRGVSDRLSFTGGSPESVSAAGLPELTTFSDIASAIGVPPEKLQWLTYERGAANMDHYSRFEIPKRSGGMRLISSPKPDLRAAQNWVREKILIRLPVHSAATAFRPGMSVVDNAERHTNSQVVVRVDLKDFFPSITFHRVRGYFEYLGYNPGVASVLALICTDAPRVRLTRDGETHFVAIRDRSLPQGACTSPDLANLIAGSLDWRLAGLAARTSWVYTRYADDLVFSSSDPGSSPHRLIRSVTAINADEGFTVNTTKTRIMRAPNRQAVTGLLVNNGVQISRRDRKRIRAFLHRCETQGVDLVSQQIGKNARAVARGYYAWVHMVSPGAASELMRKHPWI